MSASSAILMEFTLSATCAVIGRVPAGEAASWVAAGVTVMAAAESVNEPVSGRRSPVYESLRLPARVESTVSAPAAVAESAMTVSLSKDFLTDKALLMGMPDGATLSAGGSRRQAADAGADTATWLTL